MSPPRELSVLHVIWSGDTGGVERLVVDLAEEQAHAGTRVGVAFGRASGPFARAAVERGLPCLDLGLVSGWDLIGAARPAARAVAAWDLVHLHGFNVPLAAVVLRAGRPIVFTDHGRDDRRPNPADRVKRRLERRFLRRSVHAVTANSRWTARRLTDTYGIDRSRIAVVHNGVRSTGRDPHPEPGGGDGILVAFVGRLVPRKRVDRLLTAVSAVNRPDVRVRVIGTGPLEAHLREYAARIGVADRVEFLGLRTDVPDLLDSADVLVLSSQDEPFGLAGIEGCERGLLPIVFADGGGALEALPPDGVIVQDVNALAMTLDKLVGSSALSTAARVARVAWVRDAFPIARTAVRYDAVYRRATQ